MAKHKYYVDFSITLSTSRVIAADSEDDAMRIAEDLKLDNDFYKGIVSSMEYDYDAWRSKYCDVEVFGVAPDSVSADNETEE